MILFPVATLAAQHSNEIFEAWKKTHGKEYATAGSELAALSAFEANDRMIRAHNAEPHSYELGHNAFSDLTSTEFRRLMVPALGVSRFGGLAVEVDEVDDEDERHSGGGTLDTVDDIDWSARGAVTGVKNQVACGGCWAFAATGAIESAYAIAGGELTALSEQQILSCDTVGQACRGGNIEQAIEWVSDNHPLCTEKEWPYTSGGGQPGECFEVQKQCSPLVAATGFRSILKDEARMQVSPPLLTLPWLLPLQRLPSSPSSLSSLSSPSIDRRRSWARSRWR